MTSLWPGQAPGPPLDVLIPLGQSSHDRHRQEDFEFSKDCFGLDQCQARARWFHQRAGLARDAAIALVS